MPKIDTPLTLYHFTTQNSELTPEQVRDEFITMMEWMKENQTTYFENHFNSLAREIIDNGVEYSGSTNSAGRLLGVEPLTKAATQHYNMSEMFRANVVSRLTLHLQNEALTDLIDGMGDPSELKAKDVRAAFKSAYPNIKTPRSQFIINALDRLSRLGTVHGLPGADGKLPLWATDTHYCKIVQDGKTIYMTIKLSSGPVTCVFTIPKADRFSSGKVTRPNVRWDKKRGRIAFDFTIQDAAPELLEDRAMRLGIDLNRITGSTFVACLVGPQGYSSPFYDSTVINRLSKKINRLFTILVSIRAKIDASVEHGRDGEDKLSRLVEEARRVRAKITRLKAERALRVAARIVEIAACYGATIVFENLAWVPSSRWEHSIQQSATEDRGRRAGVRVIKRSAKNSSQSCVVCGSRVSHSGRSTRCLGCSRRLSRDVLAPRNMAVRGGSGVVFSGLRFLGSSHTRVTRLGLSPSFRPGMLNFGGSRSLGDPPGQA